MRRKIPRFPFEAALMILLIVTMICGATGGCGGGGGGGGGSGGGSSTGSTTSPTTSPTVDATISEMETKVFNLINTERTNAGKQALVNNSTLQTVARNHSQDMIDRNFFDHINPDGLGPDNRVTNAGLQWTAVAENLAQNQGYADPAQQAVTDWMNSAGHRQNLLDENNVGYTLTGVGIARKSDGTYYFTQLFVKQ